jgi:hypothetical protein
MYRQRKKTWTIIRRAAAVLGTAAALALLAGCVTNLKAPLQYRAVKPAAAPERDVVIGDVTDQRPANRGQGDDLRVGTVRGGYGNPFPIYTKDKKSLTGFFADMLRDAASEAGWRVVDGAGPRLVLDIGYLWCDGAFTYQIDFAGTLSLVSADGKTILANREIKVRHETATVWGPDDVTSAYPPFFTKILDALRQVLASDEFAKVR